MKVMKHAVWILALLLVGVIALDIISNISTGNVLRIHNWEDYIAPDLIDEFEEYYEAKHGEPIKVIYSTFDTNETLHTKVIKSNRPADLMCPSEYMVDRMMSEGKLAKINYDNIPNYYIWADEEQTVHERDDDGNPLTVIDPSLQFLPFDPEGEYYVPYMWGTLGILYNTEYVTEDEVKTWGALFDTEKYKYKIYMKDSIRDTLGITNIYTNRDSLANATGEEYTALLNEYMNMDNPDTVEDILRRSEESLIKQKKYLKGYEVDNGKDEIVTGSAYMGLAWSGDAVWSIVENPELAYYVPEEGSNIWLDSWVIPKNAKNKTAAEEFINFLLEPENAHACMDEIYYTSAHIGAQDMFKETLAEDYADLFDSKDDFFADMVYNALFPSEEIRSRCVVMRDFKEVKNDVINMWARVMIA